MLWQKVSLYITKLTRTKNTDKTKEKERHKKKSVKINKSSSGFFLRLFFFSCLLCQYYHHYFVPNKDIFIDTLSRFVSLSPSSFGEYIFLFFSAWSFSPAVVCFLQSIERMIHLMSNWLLKGIGRKQQSSWTEKEPILKATQWPSIPVQGHKVSHINVVVYKLWMTMSLRRLSINYRLWRQCLPCRFEPKSAEVDLKRSQSEWIWTRAYLLTCLVPHH